MDGMSRRKDTEIEKTEKKKKKPSVVKVKIQQPSDQHGESVWNTRSEQHPSSKNEPHCLGMTASIYSAPVRP